MSLLSNIAFKTEPNDRIVLAAAGLRTDPLRVLLLTEEDYALALKSNNLSSNSRAMPILSSDQPQVTLTMPFEGSWRIVYQAADAELVTVSVVPQGADSQG